MNPAPAGAGPSQRRFNPWMWLPAGVILLAAIPNLALVLVARQVHISKVEEQPWLAAERLNERTETQRRFAAQASLAVLSEGRQVVLRIDGVPPSDLLPLHVLCYRPSAASEDRRLTWQDPGSPLTWDAPLPGRWVIVVESDGLAVAERSIELP